MITTAHNILKTLGYFDLFHYPLTKQEICLFHSADTSCPVIEQALKILVDDKTVFRFGDLYALQNDPALAQRRNAGNLLAIEQIKTAHKVAKLLAAFPFIKGIAVSGSLSKNFADKNSDIDFFIVTAANRLWVARTFMHLYKKITFLTGRQHWFCMNYYVDEAGLEIPEKNIFTAIEIVTLLPMYGKSGLNNFINYNKWTQHYFPQHQYTMGDTPEIKAGIFTKGIEKILGGNMGDALDKWLMNITGKRWKKKAERHQLNNRGGNMGMTVDRHFSKPDPKNFQDKVVKQYEDKVKQLLQQQDKTPFLFL